MSDDNTNTNVLELTADITVAWLSNGANRVASQDLPLVLRAVHGALSSIIDGSAGEEEQAPEYAPAVTSRRSLASKDHILSMIDGKPYKMLKRHLSINGLTPTEYRQRYNLKPDYPMVAESYAAMRRDLAKKIGLGRKGRGGGTAAAPATPKAARQPRAKKA